MNHKYSMVVASDTDWCIGKDGNLLTRISLDMKSFRALTTGKIVVMGSKTQESLPNHLYLKNRINLILSRKAMRAYPLSQEDENTYLTYLTDIDYVGGFIDAFNDVQDATNRFPQYSNLTDRDVFIIGGGQIYKEFLDRDMIDTIFLTKIYNQYHGDTFIPNLDELGFKVVDTILPRTVDENGTEFEILVLRK